MGHAATSAMPPASAIAVCSARHHASGSTDVPSGCAARPCRTMSPVAASMMTTLHDCVDESTPITSAMRCLSGSGRGDDGGSAGAEQVLGGQLLQPDEAEALAAEVSVRV